MAIEAQEKYVTAAKAHLQLLLDGDVKGSNLAHDRLVEAAKGVRAQPDGGRDFLIVATGNQNESVRCWAAHHLLTIEPTVSVKVLKKLRKEAKHWQIASDAEMILSEWKAGRLNPDWYLD